MHAALAPSSTPSPTLSVINLSAYSSFLQDLNLVASREIFDWRVVRYTSFLIGSLLEMGCGTEMTDEKPCRLAGLSNPQPRGIHKPRNLHKPYFYNILSLSDGSAGGRCQQRESFGKELCHSQSFPLSYISSRKRSTFHNNKHRTDNKQILLSSNY
jgi:hypothetical protein